MTPALNERIARRRAFRVGLFQRRGLDAAQAETWADRLTRRDADRDDRHLCIECLHRQQDHGCAEARAGRLPGLSSRFDTRMLILQRCPLFAWVTP